ncbi:protein canopy homolog 2-like [Lineus longissimus]|uniref:protein canopy homolog 2-like n=1 Tax=Lineus longissimus TaxID=88925 RepID=UPI002B4D74F5
MTQTILKDVTILLAILMVLLQMTVAKIDKSYYCGACLAIVQEVNIKIGEVDPNKKVEVGSFRVDPDGKQKLKKVSYATSEVYLTEVFEKVCESMHEYGEKFEKDLDVKLFPRTNRPDSAPIDLIGVEMNEGIFKKLKSACHTIVEDHEDEMIKLFKKKSIKRENLGRDICLNLAKVCTGNEVLAKLMWDKTSEERKFKSAKAKKQEEIQKQAEEAIRRQNFEKAPVAGEAAKQEL